jgi:hypothetical protein
MPDVVDLHVFLRAAQLTGVRKQSRQQLGPHVPDAAWLIVDVGDAPPSQ